MRERERSHFTLARLAAKGCKYPIPLIDKDTWQTLIEADPSIPRSYSQLKRYTRLLFDPALRRMKRIQQWSFLPPSGLLVPAFEECAESTYHEFFTGLANPSLTDIQRQELEADIDADTADFENSIETDHFILRWTNSSVNAADNIADSSIVTETGDYLETAWDVFSATFGRDPHTPPGETKIEVLFHDIAWLGVASPADGPLQFDAPSWINNPGIRQPTSAHELFHKLQYAFGYRTIWSPSVPYKWFSEGSASWAEVFVWQRVSGSYKILDLFTGPDRNLFDASYRALPFWIFFQARQQDSPTDNPMVSFLQKYEVHGDEELALEEAINDEWAPNNVYRELAHFFALFSRERAIGAWKAGPSGALYGDIIAPDGVAIVPALTTIDVPLSVGDTYTSSGAAVSPLGSDYYAFGFESGTDGATVTVSVDGATTGDYSYYLLWQKGGAFKRAVFPFGVKEDYSLSETIDLSFADSLTVIVSGRGTGGPYTIVASVG